MIYKLLLIDLAIGLIPFLGIFLFYYLVLWLPEQREKLAQLEFIAQLKPSDWVETKSGIIGQILDRNENVLIILSDKTTLAIQAWAVSKKIQ